MSSIKRINNIAQFLEGFRGSPLKITTGIQAVDAKLKEVEKRFQNMLEADARMKMEKERRIQQFNNTPQAQRTREQKTGATRKFTTEEKIEVLRQGGIVLEPKRAQDTTRLRGLIQAYEKKIREAESTSEIRKLRTLISKNEEQIRKIREENKNIPKANEELLSQYWNGERLKLDEIKQELLEKQQSTLKRTKNKSLKQVEEAFEGGKAQLESNINQFIIKGIKDVLLFKEQGSPQNLAEKIKALGREKTDRAKERLEKIFKDKIGDVGALEETIKKTNPDFKTNVEKSADIVAGAGERKATKEANIKKAKGVEAAKAKKKEAAAAAEAEEAAAADAEAERARQLEEERQVREATIKSQQDRAQELFNERFADPTKRPTGKDPKLTGESKEIVFYYNRLRQNRIRDLDLKAKADKVAEQREDQARRTEANRRRREQQQQQQADEALAEAEAKRQAIADNRQAVVDEFNKGNNGDYDSVENKEIRGFLGESNLSAIDTKEKEQAAKAMLTAYLITPKINETDYYKEEDLERFLGTIGGVGVDKTFLRGAFGLQLDAEPDDPSQRFGQENLLHRTGDMVNRVVNRAMAGEKAYNQFNKLTFKVTPQDYGPSENLPASVFTAGRATQAPRDRVPSNYGVSGFVTTPEGKARRRIGRVRNVQGEKQKKFEGLAFRSRLTGVEGEGAEQGIFGQDTGLNVIAAVGTTLGSQDVRILHQTLGSEINKQGAKLNYLDPLHPAFAEVSRGKSTLGQDLTKTVSGFTATSKVNENMADTLANLGLGGGMGRETGVPQSTGAPAGINVSLETLKDKIGDAFQRAGAVDYETEVGVSFDPSQAANVNPRAFKDYRKASIISSPFPREPRVIMDLKKGFHLIGENDDIAVMAQQFA